LRILCFQPSYKVEGHVVCKGENEITSNSGPKYCWKETTANFEV